MSIDGPQQRNVIKKVIVLVVAGVVLLAAAFFLYLWIEELRYEQQLQESRLKSVRTVQDGDDGRYVIVYDSQLLQMLAEDSRCVANLTYLSLHWFDLTAPEVLTAARKLKNVKTITVYDCRGVEKLLMAMQGLKSLEGIELESVFPVDDELIRSLTTFPNLEQVTIRGVDVDDAQQDKLRKALPYVVVTIE